METQEGSIRNRVCIYELNGESEWEDKGVGYVFCVFVDSKDSFCLVVRKEDDGVCILSSSIRPGCQYRIQQETLLQWTETSGKDYAISFQEAEGCLEIFDAISDAQRRMEVDVHDIDSIPLVSNINDLENLQSPRELPPPELANLADIEQILQLATKSVFCKAAVIPQLTQTNYIETLLPLLSICEDLESQTDLFRLSNIMRSIITLNECDIISYILLDEVFISVLGMLECEILLKLDDKEYPKQRANYRDFIIHGVKFKEVIPINDPDLVALINQTYRAQYLKDIVLARILPDSTFALFQSITYFNNVEIIGSLCKNVEFLKQLFQLFSTQDLQGTTKKDIVLLLNEMCQITKGLQRGHQVLFYQTLGENGLFGIFEFTMGDPDESVRSGAVSILANILQHDPRLVKLFCLEQAENNVDTIVALIITRFLAENSLGLMSQIADLIKVLLDTTGVGLEGILKSSIGQSEIDAFLELFYLKYSDKLFAPFAQIDGELNTNPSLNFCERDIAILDHLCSLLTFMISQHAMFSKKHLTAHDWMIRAVSSIHKCKFTYLKLSSLRVFRVCMGTNDEFYRRLLLKQDSFGPIFTMLLETKGQNNVLNSACLEFFDYIRKVPSRSIIMHIVTHYKKYFSQLEYVDIFRNIQMKFDDFNESTDSKEQRDSDKNAVRDGWAKVDASEEAYFNESDDEDPSDINISSKSISISQVSRNIGVVDYPDDADDSEDELITTPLNNQTAKITIALKPKI